MLKHTILVIGIMLIGISCDSKKEPECPRCEACAEVPSEVSVLEKYKKDWVCIDAHCYKVLQKNAETK